MSSETSSMRRKVDPHDVALFGKLDMIYNQLRFIEAKQNETRFACKGSGNCCRIGLRVHMLECANVAFNIRQQYYLHMEDNGQEAADGYMSDIVEKLLTRMYDESWNEDGETTEFCAFYDNGCTIYPFRPMVCRTVGTISHVDDFCPRERNEGGNIDFFSGEPVREAIRAFQDLMMEYAAGKEADQNYDMVVYMPLGILAFLLENDQINELYLQTDPKFWQGADGWFNYRTYFTKKYGYSDEELTSAAKAAGLDVIFEDKIEIMDEIER